MPFDAVIMSNAPISPRGTFGAPSLLDTVTGGEYSEIKAQLARLEWALRIAILASVVSGIAGVLSLVGGRRGAR